MNIMIITALFDIKRAEKGDGRSVNDYLQWFKETLKIKCDMTVYTEKRFEQFVLDNRKDSNYKTRIIIQKFEEIPFYKNIDRIDAILKDSTYKSKIQDPNRIECYLPEYNVIQYSKFGWLKMAVNDCPEHDYFFWMDAGCSRFFEGFDLTKKWPNTRLLNKDKFIIQGNINTPRLWNMVLQEEYRWEKHCVVVGTLFGGGRDVLLKIHDIMENVCEDRFFSKGCVNNEQIALAIAAKLYPEIFEIRISPAVQYIHLPLFTELSQ